MANPGVQHAFRLARALHRRQMLGVFHTALAFGIGSPWVRFLAPVSRGTRVGKALRNRTVEGVPAAKVRTHLALEMEANWRIARGEREADALHRRNAAFQMRIPSRDIEAADVVVGTDTAGHILARRCVRADRPFVLSRSIGHGRAWNRVLDELSERHPEWVNDGLRKTNGDLRREDTEHRLAKRIVVPSRFVAGTLAMHGVAAERVVVNPFGADVGEGLPRLGGTRRGGMVFLFAGQVSARKGVPILLDAWRVLGARSSELWIAGPGDPPPGAGAGLEGVRWLGAMARSDLEATYRRADVFVFPSLFEGFAKVVAEAAGAGLAIIATRASGAEEVVEDGVNGWLVPEWDVTALAKAMEGFVSNPSLARQMGDESARLAGRLTWEAYGARWRAIIDEVSRSPGFHSPMTG